MWAFSQVVSIAYPHNRFNEAVFSIMFKDLGIFNDFINFLNIFKSTNVYLNYLLPMFIKLKLAVILI